MRQWSCWVCVYLLTFIALPAQSATRLQINGVADEIAENIRLITGNPNTLRPELATLFVQTLPQQTADALAALGYFSPEIKITRELVPATIDPRAEKDGSAAPTDEPQNDTLLTVDITLNDPVRINLIDLRILGSARGDEDYMPVVADIALRKGAIFNSGVYETTKAVLIDHAENLGYFDFKFERNEVRVSKSDKTADISLYAESGARYVFGPMVFDNDALDERFLKRWVPFDVGDPYAASSIAELTKSLQSSGYFKSVRVVPQRDNRYGKTVPIRVELKRRDTNEVGVGAGFSTDTGIRGKLTWAIPRLNRRGHSVKAAIESSAIKQNASAEYRIPRKNNPLQNFYTVEYGLQREDVVDSENIKSIKSSLRIQRVTQRPHDWRESLFIRHDTERTTDDDSINDTTLIMPGFNYSRTRSKGQPFVTWGQSANFQLFGGNKTFGSSIDIAKLTFNLKYLRAISARTTAIASVQYGVISTSDYDRVPASLQFFAGGDNSIRGFGYNTIGHVEEARVALGLTEEGEVVGGRFLEIFSAELNYRLRDRWSVAIFADGGRAFNNIEGAYRLGAGVGVRWQSPVGPFRLDIAKPMSDVLGDSDAVRVHLSLGPEI